MSPEELFDEADRLEEAGDERRAFHLWKELARISPEPVALCRLGWLADELGEREEAERAFRRAITVDDRFASAYLALGSMAIDRGGFAEAEALLRRANQLEPTRSGYCMLGVALKGLGHESEARQSYLKSIEIDPGFEEAYYNLGALVRHSNPAEALGLFAKALELDPDYAPAHSELGWLLRRDGLLGEAEYHLRRAVEIQPENAWAHVYLGNLLWERKDLRAAVSEYEWAREAAPDRAFPLWSLANLYEDSREWEKAEALYEQALQKEPDDAVGNMNFGRMLLKKGEPSRARILLERALLLNANDREAKFLLESALDSSDKRQPGHSPQ